MPTMLKRCRGICTALLGFVAVAVLVLALTRYSASAAIPAQLTDPVPFSAGYYAAVNERFGVGLNVGIPITDNGTPRQAQITDYDVGLEGRPDIKPVTTENIIEIFKSNNERLRSLLFNAIPEAYKIKECSCNDALKGAVIE